MTKSISRRQFLQTVLLNATGAFALPTILPASVFGQNRPSNQIHVGQIGCGRIANEMDLPGILKQDIARVVALCDVDSKRLNQTTQRVQNYYAAKQAGNNPLTVKLYADYRGLLKDPGIDAVAISTPDHWHSEPVMAAALAGKDIYVQKPLSMTIAEGRAVSDTVRAKGRMFQIGSQQRSDAPWPQFRRACELVRNGRIGKVHTVRIGLPTDPAGEEEPEMPVPANLNYDMWLGCTPAAPYTQTRVHPQNSLSDRPGWLRIESYCLGMITAWGSHHVDIAHWGIGMELTGPVEAEGRAEFPKRGLWNVHGPFHVEMKYPNGVSMLLDNNFPNGVRFEGSEGWIFVSRGSGKATASDPATGNSDALAASSRKILDSKLGPNETHLHASPDHHLDWLRSIQSRQPGATSAEIAHRSTSACEIGWIAMKLGRKLHWDPVREEFVNDPQANTMRSRPQRPPYGTEALLKQV